MLRGCALWRRDRRHRFDALALARHDQTQAIVSQRAGPVGMPDHAHKSLDIRLKSLFTVDRPLKSHRGELLLPTPNLAP